MHTTTINPPPPKKRTEQQLEAAGQAAIPRPNVPGAATPLVVELLQEVRPPLLALDEALKGQGVGSGSGTIRLDIGGEAQQPLQHGVDPARHVAPASVGPLLRLGGGCRGYGRYC